VTLNDLVYNSTIDHYTSGCVMPFQKLTFLLLYKENVFMKQLLFKVKNVKAR